MNAQKKQRDKHSSRSADLRLRQPFSSWAIGLQVPRQPTPPTRKYASLNEIREFWPKIRPFRRVMSARGALVTTGHATHRRTCLVN